MAIAAGARRRHSWAAMASSRRNKMQQCSAWALVAVLLAAQSANGLRIGSTMNAYVAPFLAALGPEDNHGHKCRPSQVRHPGCWCSQACCWPPRLCTMLHSASAADSQLMQQSTTIA